MSVNGEVGTHAHSVTAALLVGGQGTRLRSVIHDVPKPLAPIGDRSFLTLLVQQLSDQGIRNLVMCTGHLSAHVQREFGDGSSWDCIIEYSNESEPLGTGGALKLAGRHVSRTSDLLVMNGDSFLEMDFNELIGFHHWHGGVATVAVVPVDDAHRFGTVRFDSAGRVVEFAEKTGINRPGWINGGVYVFSHTVFDHIPEGKQSLETDVFPRLLSHGVYASQQRGRFIDIGTPADYERAQHLLREVCLRRIPNVPQF